MRHVLVALVVCALSAAAHAQSLPPASPAGTHAIDFTHAARTVPDLVCPRKKAQAPKAAARPASTPTPAPTELPDVQEIEAALGTGPAAIAPAPTPAVALTPALPGWRIAVWGDSHMAAGYFTDELARRLAPSGDGQATGFISAGIGHAGVRQAVRASCLSGPWSRELAHAHGQAAPSPGPGLSTLVARQAGAGLALDLRDAQARPVLHEIQVLHDGASQGPVTLAVSVDGEPPVRITLAGARGPSRLQVRSQVPISTLSVQVLEGQWRLQGLRRPHNAAATQAGGVTLDQFGFPGATAAGWARADLQYLGAWFDDVRYDLVVMAFGTNEANDPQFNETGYREMLTRAVSQWRQLQPQAQCVLIAPGDRGVRVARAARRTGSSARATRVPPAGPRAAAAASPDLLRFSRLHERIAQIQGEVALAAGCAAWSMQAGMGGSASAYAWARGQPPLMAPDLIHFTRAGYRELAARFIADMGLQR